MTEKRKHEIANTIVVLERKKLRLLDALFLEDELFAEEVLERIQSESEMRRTA